MTLFQLGSAYLTMATVVLAWLRGGHSERLGAGTILVWALASVTAPAWLNRPVADNLFLFEAALETVVLIVFVRMALQGPRWWPFAAAAVMTLSVMVYVAQFFVPLLDRRAEISAHVGLLIALNLTLLAGIGERWLAGEPPVCNLARRGDQTASPFGRHDRPAPETTELSRESRAGESSKSRRFRFFTSV